MQDNYLLPAMKAIQNDASLAPKKKDILCLLIASLQIDAEGMALSELHSGVQLSRDRMYKILTELENGQLIIRIKKGRNLYVKPNIDSISALITKNESKTKLKREVLKLKFLSKQ